MKKKRISNMFKWLNQYSGVITMIGMFAMFVLTLWFKTQITDALKNYTPLSKTQKIEQMVVDGFTQNGKDHAAITVAVTGIEKSLALIAQNSLIIQDHESRIRLLTERQIDNMARVKALELIHPPEKK